MTNVDFGNPKSGKIFGTVEASVDLAEATGNDELVKRAFSAFTQVPFRFYCDNVLACEGDPAEYIFFVVRGSFAVAEISKRESATSLPFIYPGISRLDGSKALARSSNRRRGAVYQTERVIVPRVTGKSNCHFFAARDDQ